METHQRPVPDSLTCGLQIAFNLCLQTRCEVFCLFLLDQDDPGDLLQELSGSVVSRPAVLVRWFAQKIMNPRFVRTSG